MTPLARPAPTNARESVIALHCSGANGSQWRALGETLGERFTLTAPDHFGCDSTGPWTGAHAFTLADEAARTLALIDGSDRKVHLVGHSYGGGVALHVALARPERIASLTLYEPSAFHLLLQLGHGREALDEIRSIALAVATGVVTGDYRGALRPFVDYWNGQGAWEALRPAMQDALTAWVPKAPLDFHALFGEPTPLAAYAKLAFPVLVMRGEHAPAATRLIATELPALLPDARLAVIAGAGHMGPLTHAAAVNALAVAHIAAAAEARTRTVAA